MNRFSIPAPAAMNIRAEKQSTATPPTDTDRIPPKIVELEVNPQMATNAHTLASVEHMASTTFAFRTLSCLFSGLDTTVEAHSPSREFPAMIDYLVPFCPRLNSSLTVRVQRPDLAAGSDVQATAEKEG